MDYSALAAELLSFRTALHHLPAVRGLDELSGGEYFVLHFLLRHGGTAGPSELSRSLYASSARIAARLKHCLLYTSGICRSAKFLTTSIVVHL